MTLDAFQSWLNNYLNFEKTQAKNIFWLESMKFLAEKLGNPQNKIPCFHVAGSKGKGSTSEMIGSILENAGFKCGIYSSPHITDFRERISLPHGFFEDKIYEKSADELTSLVDSIPLEELPGQRPLTWFELVTLFAFLCFKNAECDYVVYEVGLGGRLDSTNIVNPLLSVLMPIELEHTEFLGDTITKIAGEKAGIIKENVPCVMSFQNYPDAEKVFHSKAEEKHSTFFSSKELCTKLFFAPSENGTMETAFTLKDYGDFKTSLKLFGKVQAQNAVTAALSVKKAVPEISVTAIEKGLSEAFLPGRFEVKENLILDGAHTVKSIANTLSTLDSFFPSSNVHLLFACAGDKDIKDIVPLFKNRFKSITFTEPLTVRHCNAEKVLKTAEENGISAFLEKNTEKAFKSVSGNLKNNDILLVTGSFYLVSEIKKLISEEM